MSHGRKFFFLLAICSLGAALYLRSLSYDFIYDDLLQITRNEQITLDQSPPSFVALFLSPSPPGNLFRPLTLLTYKITYSLAGANPVIFHLTNIVLFAVTICLFFCLVSKIFSSQIAALIASLLFAVHPVNVEVVASVVGRAELLACLFGLISCLSLFRAVTARAIHSQLGWTAGFVVMVIAAALSKESGIVYAILAPVYTAFVCDWRAAQVSRRNLRLATFLFSVIFSCVIPLLIRLSALGDRFILRSDSKVWVENPIFHLPINLRLLPAIKLLGDYIRLWLIPTGLAFDYSQTLERLLSEVFSINGLFSVALVALVAALIWMERRRKFALGGIWFFLAFSLTCNIITPIGTVFANRLLFTPSIGLSILAVGALEQHLTRRVLVRAAISASLLYATLMALMTVDRVSAWSSNMALFRRMTVDRPENPKAHYMLGIELYTARRYEECGHELQRALQIHPNYLLAMRMMADLHLALHDYPRVKYWYQKILENDPAQLDVKTNLENLEKALHPVSSDTQ